MSENNKIILYQDDNEIIRVSVRFSDEDLWLTQNQFQYLQPIITQYFIDNKSEIWLLFLIAHSKR